MTSFEEGRVLFCDFMDALFDVLESDERFAGFILDGQMAVLQHYLELMPHMKARIRRHAESGRLSLGPWWVLADEFLPSGESHVRNLLYGMQAARAFDSSLMVGYLPDQFGHIAQMPQILRGFGIAFAVIYRGFGGEKGQESSEWEWCAPDGSSVLTVHLPRDGYSFGYFANDNEEEALARFMRLKQELDERAMTSQRFVLNGGDRHWPDRTVTRVAKMLSERTGCQVVHSTLPRYFDSLQAELHEIELPKISGETRFGLRHAFAVVGGTASSRMVIKQENYRCQSLLLNVVEPLNALNVLAGNNSRKDLIRHAWYLLLSNQEHDVICGTSIDSVYREAMVRFKRVQELGEAVAKQAFEELIDSDDVPSSNHVLAKDGENVEGEKDDDRTLVFFNPLPYERTEVVECEIDFHLKDVVIGINPDAKGSERVEAVKGFRLLDEQGEEVTYQILKREEAFGLIPSRTAYPRQLLVERFTCLVSVHLRPCGFTSIAVERADSFQFFESPIICSENSLRDENLRVAVEPDGTISMERDGHAFTGLNCFEDGGDVGDEYSWCFPENDRIIRSSDYAASVKLIERGPLRAKLLVTTRIEIPVSASDDLKSRSDTTDTMEIQTAISITAHSPRVDVRTELHNTTRDHRLRVLFPTGLRTNISHADAQFAIVRREHRAFDWDEFDIEKPLNLEVMQRFVTVQDEQKAFTLMSRGLPEYELATDGSGLLALTLLRCVGELSRSNLATRPGGDAGWKNSTPEAQCIGQHVFEYGLLLHSATQTFEEVLQEARSYHTRVTVLARKARAEMKSSRFQLDAARAELTCLKEAEDGSGVIIRLCNPTGLEEMVSMRFSSDAAVSSASFDEQISEAVLSKKQTSEIVLEPYKIRTLYFL